MPWFHWFFKFFVLLSHPFSCLLLTTSCNFTLQMRTLCPKESMWLIHQDLVNQGSQSRTRLQAGILPVTPSQFQYPNAHPSSSRTPNRSTRSLLCKGVSCPETTFLPMDARGGSALRVQVFILLALRCYSSKTSYPGDILESRRSKEGLTHMKGPGTFQS